MSDTLIKVENIAKKFCLSLQRSLWYGMQDLGNELLGRRHSGDGELRPDEFWAVKDISFELKRGQCLGLIGHNGAGKTTLLRMLNGLIKPDHGRIEILGRIGSLIALGAGFNPILTGRENIYVNAAILGFTKNEIDRKFDDIVTFAGLEDFINTPVKHYSSGMFMRLGFAVASHSDPDILLVDEALAVGDATFRRKCIELMSLFVAQGGVIVYVSHSLNEMRRFNDTTLWMNKGCVQMHGDPNEVCDRYQLQMLGDHAQVEPATLARRSPKEAGPRILQVTMERTIFHTGDDIAIEIRVETAALEHPFGVGVVIRNHLGQSVTVCNTLRDDMVMPDNPCVARLLLPENDLIDGCYSIDVSLMDKMVLYAYDNWTTALRFSVHTPLSQSGLKIAEGHFRARHHWEFIGEENIN